MNLDNLRRYGVELEFASEYDMYETARLIQARTGVEIHVRSYSDKSNLWRLKSDSSVRGRGHYGMELVTPILQGEQDMETLKSIVKVCDEIGTVNRTCGMHVHIDITNADTLPLRKLMKFFAKYEKGINRLLAPSRRGNENGYCRDSFGYDRDLMGIFGRLNRLGVRRLLRTEAFCGRGKWNFQNYWRHGSVENRAHQGTLNVEKVENWVRLTQAFVAAAFDCRGTTIRQGDSTDTYTAKNLLDDLRNKKLITLPVKKFYMRRYKELNNEVCR